MADSNHSGPESLEGGPKAPDQLAASARGWHRIQLAVLGFIGFCGVFWAREDSATPAEVQWFSLALVVLAFVLALVAIFRVGRVAYPFSGAAQAAGPEEPTTARRTRRLRTGIWATYIAVGVLVAATLPAWWPTAPDDGAVIVGDTTGQVWCGDLLDAPTGEIRLDIADGPVTIPLGRVALVRAVGGC